MSGNEITVKLVPENTPPNRRRMRPTISRKRPATNKKPANDMGLTNVDKTRQSDGRNPKLSTPSPATEKVPETAEHIKDPQGWSFARSYIKNRDGPLLPTVLIQRKRGVTTLVTREDAGLGA